MKKREKKEKKRVIQMPQNDIQLMEFFRRYLRFLERVRANNINITGKYDRILTKYEKIIYDILNIGYAAKNSPVLYLIQKFRFNTGEFKTFMYLLCEFGEREVQSRGDEDEEDFELDEDTTIPARRIIETFYNDSENIRTALFSEKSKLSRKDIIKVNINIKQIPSGDYNASVRLSDSILKHFRLTEFPGRDKNIKLIRQEDIKEPLTEDITTLLDKYINPETSTQLYDAINLIQRTNNLLQEKKEVEFPVILLYGKTQREIQLVIWSLARQLKRDILEYRQKKDVEEDFSFLEESDFESDPHLEEYLRTSYHGDYILNIHINTRSDLKKINYLFSRYQESRKNLIIITSQDRLNIDGFGIDKVRYSYIPVQFKLPDEETRKRLWINRIPSRFYDGTGYEEFTKRFGNFGLEHIELTVKKALERMNLDGKNVIEDGFITDAATDIERAMDSYFTESEIFESNIENDSVLPKEKLSDVILNAGLGPEIQNIIRIIRNKDSFYKDVLGTSQTYGKGIKILFFGPPGTGKTLTARAIAGEAGMPFLELNLSKLMNPLVGMTEKKIVEYFKMAKRENAVLFIDECDSLILSRERLNHSWEFSHINVLLKQIEDFDGILIMSTNFEEVRDKAINRRMHFFIKFDMPCFESRRRLLNYIVPEKYHNTFDLDRISRIEFTGGDLRNVWLRVGQKIFCDKNVDTDVFIEELKREREKYNEETCNKKCGF